MTQIFQVTFPEETFGPLEEELMTEESIQHLF